MKKPPIPEDLNRFVDKVLAFRPKPKSKAAKKRAKQKQVIELNRNMERAAD